MAIKHYLNEQSAQIRREAQSAVEHALNSKDTAADNSLPAEAKTRIAIAEAGTQMAWQYALDLETEAMATHQILKNTQQAIANIARAANSGQPEKALAMLAHYDPAKLTHH